MSAQAREVKRYTLLEGLDIGESTPEAQRVKINGEWHWVPKSLITAPRRNHAQSGSDSMVVEEWFAKKKGWIL